MSTTAHEEIKGRIEAIDQERNDCKDAIERSTEAIERAKSKYQMLTSLRDEYAALIGPPITVSEQDAREVVQRVAAEGAWRAERA